MATFNVKTYGAVGDARMAFDAVVTVGSPVVESVTATFTSADVGRLIWVTDPNYGSAVLSPTTVASFTDSQHVNASINANATGGGAVCIATQDDTSAFVAAYDAAVASMLSGVAPGRPGIIAAPAGGYVIGSRFYRNTSGPASIVGPSFIGDGRTATGLFLRPDMTIPGDGSPALIQNTGFGARFEDFAVLGGFRTFPMQLNQDMIQFTSATSCVVRDISIIQLGGTNDSNMLAFRGETFGNIGNVTVQNSTVGSTMTAGYLACSGVFTNCFFSNFPRNLAVTGNAGRTPISGPLLWKGGGCDETADSTPVQIFGGGELNVIGAVFYGSPNSTISVDGTSSLWIRESNVGRFQHTGEGGRALDIAVGGVVRSSGTTYRGNIPGQKFINNSGKFIDEGGNDYRLFTSDSAYTNLTPVQAFNGNLPVTS